MKKQVKEKIKVFEEYFVELDGLKVGVKIIDRKEVFVKEYLLGFPSYGKGTDALLDTIKASLITESNIEANKLIDPKFIHDLKEMFSKKAEVMLTKNLPDLKSKHRIVARFNNIRFNVAGEYAVEVLLNGELKVRYPLVVEQVNPGAKKIK